ncbi:MAG: hypothetical protein FJ265_16860 [Planctomycetes bacterium]|nr:hypothetical protein [Planctomycetota bacterium]
MIDRRWSRAFAFLFVAIAPSCGGGGSGGSPGPQFGIQDGQARPSCTSVVTRTDLVAPATVDTANWHGPQKVAVPINTDCPEDDTEISPDGQTLFFYGSPVYGPGAGEILTGTTGMYVAPRTGGPGEFGTPRFLDLRKGTTGAGDGHARLAPSGDHIYFHSVRATNTGYQQVPPVDDPLDVYVAAYAGGVASPAQNLGSVNSPYLDGEPEIAPDGATLYFGSTRPGGSGGTDIYTTTLVGGTWSAPANLGAPINTAANEAQVAFADGDPTTMYFVSDRDNRGSAIYRTQWTGSAWGAPVLVVQGQVGSPSLTADGSVMYFVHVLTDNTPPDPVFGADLWYVLRK